MCGGVCVCVLRDVYVYAAKCNYLEGLENCMVNEFLINRNLNENLIFPSCLLQVTVFI